MDEQAFKQTFTATFLAAWAASRYADACARGDRHRLMRPPAEDAKELADAAWAKMDACGPT